WNATSRALISNRPSLPGCAFCACPTGCSPEGDALRWQAVAASSLCRCWYCLSSSSAGLYRGNPMRRMAVVGAGVVGRVAAHSLLKVGCEVDLYTDRSGDQWLNESKPPRPQRP